MALEEGVALAALEEVEATVVVVADLVARAEVEEVASVGRAALATALVVEVATALVVATDLVAAEAVAGLAREASVAAVGAWAPRSSGRSLRSDSCARHNSYAQPMGRPGRTKAHRTAR